MKGNRVMRFIGNRAVPEPTLHGGAEDALESAFGPNWGERIPKSMSLADLREFSKTCPNPLNSDFDNNADKGTIIIPWPTTDDLVCQVMRQWFGIVEEDPKEKPKEKPFEVNLTEPLVGWRRWIYKRGLLNSLNLSIFWFPGEALQAKCEIRPPSRHNKELVPDEDCTCGIYAVDDIKNLPNLNIHDDSLIIDGLVYGWGRYVRGEQGWRCEFAYPKEFHLRHFQGHILEAEGLKAFHVPIFIDDPIKAYDPEEEGYGNWSPKTDWDMRTSSNPDPEED